MTLKEIIEQARRNIGNNLDYIGTKYHLPELKISEAIAAEPTMNTNNPGVTPEMMNRNTLGVLADTKYIANQPGGSQYVAQKDTSNGGGGDTGGRDTGGGSGGDGYSGPTEAEIARQRYETKRREIESKLNAAKEYVKQLISGYEKTRDTTKGNIGTTYEGLKTLIGDKLKEAIGSLDQADVNVQNTYGRLSGNARRAMENVLTKNNLLAKAMGNAGSSWYQNLQAKSRNEGTTNIFDSEAEQAGKRAAIETQKGATTGEFEQDRIEAEKEKVKLLGEADAKYNEDVAKAKLLEQNYGIDSEAAIDEAQANLDDAYRQINDYTSTRKAASETGTGYTDTTSKLKNYSALGKISDTINNNYSANKAGNYVNTYSGYNPGGTIGGGTSSPLSMYNPQSPNYFLNKKKKDEEDPSQYYIR